MWQIIELIVSVFEIEGELFTGENVLKEGIEVGRERVAEFVRREKMKIID